MVVFAKLAIHLFVLFGLDRAGRPPATEKIVYVSPPKGIFCLFILVDLSRKLGIRISGKCRLKHYGKRISNGHTHTHTHTHIYIYIYIIYIYIYIYIFTYT